MVIIAVNTFLIDESKIKHLRLASKDETYGRQKATA